MILSKQGAATLPRRRSVTPQFKTQIVLEVLTRAKSMAQVCREYDLHEHVVIRWKAEFLERAPEVVASDRAQGADQARMAELERLVGRRTLELEITKQPHSS